MIDVSSKTNRRQALNLMGAATVAGAWMRPSPAPAQALPPAPMPEATLSSPWTGGGKVPVIGGQINYATLGEGPPLIMLHKLGGWVADWRHLAPLTHGRRLIALDLPGHGASSMYGPAPHIASMGEGAAIILSVLDQLGVDQFDLVGNSVGGVIAIVLAAIYPKRIRKLALISTMMSQPVTHAELAAREAEGSKPVAAIIRSPAEQAARFGTIDPRISEEQAISNRLAGDWKPATERGAALLGSASYLSRIEAPTLVISADRGAYLKYNDIARTRLADVRIATVADTGSFVHQEKPEEAARILNPFLAQ